LQRELRTTGPGLVALQKGIALGKLMAIHLRNAHRMRPCLQPTKRTQANRQPRCERRDVLPSIARTRPEEIRSTHCTVLTEDVGPGSHTDLYGSLGSNGKGMATPMRTLPKSECLGLSR
jgi:hypothetical protein